MSTPDVFLPAVLTRTIQVPYAEIARGNRQVLLLNSLRKELEGRCEEEGYVKPGSVQSIIDYSTGQLDRSFVRYTVKFEADVALPVVGQTLTCVVLENNHAGLACSIPPHNPFHVQVFRDQHHTAARLGKYPVQSTVTVAVEAFTYDINDKSIKVKAVLRDGSAAETAELDGPLWTTETMDTVGLLDIKASPKKTFVLDGSKMTRDMRLPNVIELNTRDFSPETSGSIIDQFIQEIQSTKAKTIVFPKDFGASVRPKFPDAYRYLVDRLRLVGFHATTAEEEEDSPSEESASEDAGDY